MELSEDIIYEDLSQQLTVKRSGKNITNLVLKPPRFLEKATKIERDRVYICTREVFLHCELHPDALVICLGDMIPGPWTKRQYPTLFVLDPIEIMTLFNMVQEIYERYDVWKNALVEIIPSTMSLADMVKLSLPIFMNPLDIVDHNLNVVVQGTNTANHEKFQWEPDTQSKPIAINYLLPHREKIMYFSRRKTPYVIHDNISEHYCINLFHNSTHLGYIKLKSVLLD